MTYEEFKKRITKMLREHFEDHIELVCSQVLKTNHGKVDVLSIVDKTVCKGEILCAPTACLQEYYEWYQKEGCMDTVVSAIVESYNKQLTKQYTLSLPADAQDFERVKDRIYYRVLNPEKNRELLSKVPYCDFLDLKIAFYILAVEDNNSVGSLIVRQKMIEKWGISKDKLREIAMKNTPKLFPVLTDTIADVFQKMQVESGYGQIEETMSVVTNQIWINGFGAILYPGVLQEIARNADNDLIILPSSIHEAIVISYENGMNIDEIQDIVKSVNFTLELQSEVLSNEVYLYVREKEMIQIPGKGDHYYV